MGVSQTKRVQAIDNTIAPNAQVNIVILTSEEPCNIHGLILDLHIGSLGAGLTFGQWVLSLLPRTGGLNPNVTTAGINAEADNPIFWMVGNWMVFGETIDHFGGAPRTTRNCPRGGRLLLSANNSALSGASVRIRGTATWFETIK